MSQGSRYLWKRRALIDAGRSEGLKNFEADELVQAYRSGSDRQADRYQERKDPQQVHQQEAEGSVTLGACQLDRQKPRMTGPVMPFSSVHKWPVEMRAIWNRETIRGHGGVVRCAPPAFLERSRTAYVRPVSRSQWRGNNAPADR